MSLEKGTYPWWTKSKVAGVLHRLRDLVPDHSPSVCVSVRAQGVTAVVTLNEDFEVFISSDQYKVGRAASLILVVL